MAYTEGNPSSGGSPGGGPGTAVEGGVRCTMDAPFGDEKARGTQTTMEGPFDQGRTGGVNAEDGNGGMPEKIYDGMGGPSAGAKANSRDALGTIKTDPKSPRR